MLLWHKRRYRCREDACEKVTFTEQELDLARPRGLLTTRAARWTIAQIRREHASVQGVARQLGVRWRTVWAAIKPILTAAAAEESRFAGVTAPGVDEHVWHHVSTWAPEDGGRGPKELTGMVDLTVDENGEVSARLLDRSRVVPGPRTPTGWRHAGRSSPRVWTWPPSTRSRGTRAPSAMSWPTPRRSWTPSMSSRWAPSVWTR